MQLKVIALAFGLLLAFADTALAQTYFVSISGSTPNLGTVVSSSSSPDSVWRIAPSTQAVTQLSGSGVRLSTNLTRATVTVSCTANTCDKGMVNVLVGTIGTPTNRARKLTNFTVAMGTATLKSSVTGTDPISFTIDHVNNGSSQTFYVGADFGIAPDSSGLSSGVSTSGFYVSVAKAPATGAASGTGAATATVYRPMSLQSSTSLNFGTVVRPSSGSASISVSASTGAATITGGAIVSSSTPTRATYTVTGEGGTTISLTLPTSMTLSGPSTIAVTLATDANAAPTLSSSSGSAGTYTFHYGGSFNFTSSTTTGTYSGSYTVTASYN